jgi:hypothetical protein
MIFAKKQKYNEKNSIKCIMPTKTFLKKILKIVQVIKERK